jgi:hypothetical protein
VADVSIGLEIQQSRCSVGQSGNEKNNAYRNTKIEYSTQLRAYIKIFVRRFSTSVAKADFSPTVSLYPAALGIPSPASRIVGRESKYPPARSICKLRNKCRSSVRNFLARSGFYLLRAQKNR